MAMYILYAVSKLLYATASEYSYNHNQADTVSV